VHALSLRVVYVRYTAPVALYLADQRRYRTGYRSALQLQLHHALCAPLSSLQDAIQGCGAASLNCGGRRVAFRPSGEARRLGGTGRDVRARPLLRWRHRAAARAGQPGGPGCTAVPCRAHGPRGTRRSPLVARAHFDEYVRAPKATIT
jgi:hypothetical protein